MNPMFKINSEIISSGNQAYVLQTDKRNDSSSPFNYYSHSVTTTTNFTARARCPVTPLADLYGTPGWGAGIAPFNYSELASVASELVAKARAEASESDASALVTMAELDKTFDMFLGGAKSASALVHRLNKADKDDVRRLAALPMKLIRQALKNPIAARKSFLKGCKDSFFDVASMWLGYRYGIMATYYDVESWVSAFSDRRQKPRSRYVAGKNTSYDSGNTTVTESTGNFGTNYYTKRFTRYSRSSCGVLVTMLEEADPSYTLGMRNVLSSAWELVPFSFVLDWFLDAGTRLQALESGFVRPVLGSWVTHRSVLTNYQHRYTTPRGFVIAGNDRYSAPSMDHYALVNDVTTIVERIANPPLSALPEIQIKLNYKKVIDSVALIRPASNMLANLLELR